jgi:hypothetical protein
MLKMEELRVDSNMAEAKIRCEQRVQWCKWNIVQENGQKFGKNNGDVVEVASASDAIYRYARYVIYVINDTVAYCSTGIFD